MDRKTMVDTSCCWLKYHWNLSIGNFLSIPQVSAMKAYIFSTSALCGGKQSASCPTHFITGERDTSVHWIGSWMGPRASLNALETRKISCLCQESNYNSFVIQPIAQLPLQLCYPGFDTESSLYYTVLNDRMICE